MVSVEHHTLCDGVQLQSIRDTKFKTFRISVHFLMPLAKETAAANALVPFLLTRATRRYPDFTLLSRKMDDLYGAGLGGDVGKIGDCQVLTVTASALANDYALAGENLVKEMTDVLCEALFDPVLEDGLFREEDLRQEQRQTLEQIDADFADKRVWALQRCMEAMCADEPFGVGRFGSREAVAALTREAVTDAWRTMCRTARVEILVLGDCDPRGVFESLKAAFANVERSYVPFAAAPAAAPHPSMRSRHRRMARRALRMQKLLVAYPRYACVALLALFLYLRIAVFPESGAAGLGALWIGAYLLAGLSFVFARRLKADGQ